MGVVEGEVWVALEGSGERTSPLREVMACCWDPVATVSLGGGLQRGEIVPFTLTSDLKLMVDLEFPQGNYGFPTIFKLRD